MARLPNINPVVAATSPGIYDALQSSGASKQDINAMEQVSFAYQKGLELRKLPMDVAHQEFGKLSKQAQDQLRGIFGNDPYLQAPQSFIQRATSAVKGAVKFVISPIASAMFGPVVAESKAVMAVPRVSQLVGQIKPEISVEGAAPQPYGLFSGKTWSTAYSGKDIYIEKDLDALRAKYGKANIAVAAGIVAGKTPAEIMQEYGTTFDPELGKAITASLDDKNFQGIVSEVKEARISMGRTSAKKIADYVERPNHSGDSIIQKFASELFGSRRGPLVYRTPGQSDADYQKQLSQADLAFRKRISGPVDAMYQTIIDPMTWATGGGEKTATLGVKLQQSVLAAAKEGRLAEGVAGVFENPKVASLWDNQLGPALKKFAAAEPGSAEAAQAREAIRMVAPSMDNLDHIRAMIKPGPGFEPVTDALSAQKFFTAAENTHILLGGRIDGTNFYRNGIATARNNRIFEQGKVKAIDAFFNPSLQNLSTQELLAKEVKVNEAVKILTKLGPTEEMGISQDLGKLKDLADETTRIQKMAYKLGTVFAKSPGRGVILYGNDAYKTINTFENVARLVLPRDMARVLAQKYLQMAEDEQLVMVRNLYAAYMQKQGLEGSARGRAIMQEQLQNTFAGVNGMGASATTEVPQHMAGVFSKYTTDWVNDVPTIANGGAHIPAQLTDAVAPLDFMAINKARAFSNDIPIIGLLDKATQSDFMNKFVNLWSFFTLIPRLGIRSASDEFFFYYFQQPFADVARFILGGGRKEANVLTMFTSSKDSVGPMKRAFNKVFRNGGPEDYMTLERRAKVIDDLVQDLSKDGRTVTPEEISNLLINEHVAQRCWDAVFNGATNENREAIINALKYSPDFLNGTVKSLTARTSLNGKFAGEEMLNPLFNPSQVDKAMAEVGQRTFGKPLEVGSKYYNVSETELKKRAKELLGGERPWWSSLTEEEKQKEIDKFVTLAHFDNWALRFAYNKVTLLDKHVFNPVPAFLGNGGLKTPEQVDSAVTSLMKDIGVNYSGAGELSHSVRDPKLLDSFNHKFSDTVTLRDRGLDDVQIARVHIETMLADMYTAFHGNARAFNQELYDHIKMAFEDSFEGETKSIPDYKRWEVAARKMTFEDFENLTLGKHPTMGGINTRIVIPGVGGNEIEGWFRQFGNFAFEQMDRQINGLFRQRAVVITYSRIYNANKPLMNAFAKDQAKLMLEAMPFMSEKEALAKATELAEKRYTEISMQDAVNTILKYSDNPDIRSNLSVSASTVGRFYRANEDFQRRAYRTLKDAPLRTFYRMRLLHTGLSASGSVYTDANNNQYVIFPTDSVLFAPVAKVMGAFYGPNATNMYKSAQFDEIKMKLSLINPSFSQDAGEPMLSGPAAALSVWAVKSLLDAIPSSATFKAGQALNSMALGSIGSDITLRKAVVPMFLDNLYQMLSPSDKSREAISAFTQSVDYANAFGHGLPANPTVQQLYDFRDNHRIGAHSILFMRGLLGMVSPITPTLQESKGVPSYYKEMGISSLRAEFFQILAGIQSTYGPDIQDPYALATAIFVGKNPGKSIYTVSRSNKNYHVLLTANTNMQNWAVQNKDFIAKYGDAALLFAPQIGKFNSSVYNWMQSQDMATLPSIDAYLTNVELAEAKSAYFKISQEEKAALEGNGDLDSRYQVINNAKQLREALLAQNPGLQGELGSESGLAKSRDAKTLDNLKQLVSLPNAPISAKDKINMTAAVKIMDGFINIVTDPQLKVAPNFAEIKLQERADTEAKLQQLSEANPAVAEAYKYVFMGILNQYVPDKNVVLSKGNG